MSSKSFVYGVCRAYTRSMHGLFIHYVALSLLTAQTPPSIPSVKFSYAALFDGACAQQKKYKIDPAWVSELESPAGVHIRLGQGWSQFAKPIEIKLGLG